MRSYVYVDHDLTATAYMPPGNHGPAFNLSRANGDKVMFSSEKPAALGYYRAQTTWQENRWYVDVGKKIDPLEESERLLNQANNPPKDARARLPGVEGQAHMARMADAASAANKAISLYFAQVLIKLVEEFPNETLGQPESKDKFRDIDPWEYDHMISMYEFMKVVRGDARGDSGYFLFTDGAVVEEKIVYLSTARRSGWTPPTWASYAIWVTPIHPSRGPRR